MKDFITYSPAMLKIFEQCQKKFEYKYIKEINIPVDNFKMQQGKNIHALANYYLKGFNTDKLEQVLHSEEKLLWNNLKNNKYFNFDTVASEYNVTAKFYNSHISGRLDALVKNDNDYYVLDYKTGQIPKNAETDFQTIIYLLIMDKILKNYNSLNFVYIDLKNNSEKFVRFDNDIKNEYVKILKSKLNEIEKCLQYNIYKANNKNCVCEYQKMCDNDV